ncbi:MAG TPA: hypothetical protein VIR16_12895 [Candidatus Limnocylindrales bacterium]
MKDPTTMWAAQAAEERRRLLEASRPDEQRSAEWAEDAAESATRRRGAGALGRVVGRIRRALRH